MITVATPFRGSPGGWVALHTQLGDWLMEGQPLGIRAQAEATSPDAPCVQAITDPARQLRLTQHVQVYTFAGDKDLVVPDPSRMIDGAQNHPALSLVNHSQRLGITQDPRLALELFRIMGA